MNKLTNWLTKLTTGLSIHDIKDIEYYFKNFSPNDCRVKKIKAYKLRGRVYITVYAVNASLILCENGKRTRSLLHILEDIIKAKVEVTLMDVRSKSKNKLTSKGKC